MDLITFKSTLKENQVPKNLPILVQALWYDGKGDWESAHNIAQTKEGTLSYDQLHAYLHRKEGDKFNANYLVSPLWRIYAENLTWRRMGSIGRTILVQSNLTNK